MCSITCTVAFLARPLRVIPPLAAPARVLLPSSPHHPAHPHCHFHTRICWTRVTHNTRFLLVGEIIPTRFLSGSNRTKFPNACLRARGATGAPSKTLGANPYRSRRAPLWQKRGRENTDPTDFPLLPQVPQAPGPSTLAELSGKPTVPLSHIIRSPARSRRHGEWGSATRSQTGHGLRAEA